jgi:hypothetical protein
MGAKTGYADVLLGLMGLAPGQGARDGTCYLWCEPDPGVRLLLEAYRDAGLARAAADIIRGWAGEDPRALWERLRAEGVPRGPEVDAREVARWLSIWGWHYRQGDWSSGGPVLPGQRRQDTTATATATATARLSTAPLPAEVRPDARGVEPREVARWITRAMWSYEQGNVATGFVGPGERRQDTPTVAAKLLGLPTLPAAIHPDARTLDPAPDLPAGTWVFIDPPYVGTTGYASDLPRADVVALARRWAEAGAGVMVTEAEAIPELVAEGWHAVEYDHGRVGQRRTFSRQQREVATMNRAPGRVDRLGVQASMFGGGK